MWRRPAPLFLQACLQVVSFLKYVSHIAPHGKGASGSAEFRGSRHAYSRPVMIDGS